MQRPVRTTSRRPGLRVCTLGALALTLISGFAPSRLPPGGPSVVLITVDTLRADHLGCYGFALNSSPQIDRLAAAGVVFERAIAGASATAPSHASILTSRFTRQHSIGFVNGYSRLEGVPTLASQFHRAGYATAAFISNVVLSRGRGFETGFDHYDDELPTPVRYSREFRERRAEETTAQALDWLATRREQPFFLWVHYQDPHGPYAPPPDYRGRFTLPARPDQGPLAALTNNDGIGGIPAYQVLGDVRSPNVYESRYADEIFYADVSIGRLLEAVDRAAGPRGTVVLLTADHGESFGEDRQFFVHRATTPDVAHVPMIVRASGLSPRRVPDLVHHVDILPTLLDLAGIPVPPGVSGLALAPALRANASLPERTVYTDIGVELSAYTKTGFLRIEGAADQWQQRPQDRAMPLMARATRYSWTGANQPQPIGVESALPADVVRYIRTAVPMHEAPTASDEELERLRLLGYLETAS